MGDRTTFYDSLKCGHCGEIQNEVYFAPSSGFLTHVCVKCKKENEIVELFILKLIDEKMKKELTNRKDLNIRNEST